MTETQLRSEPFDYTTWRESQWNDETIDDIWTVAENNGIDRNRGI